MKKIFLTSLLLLFSLSLVSCNDKKIESDITSDGINVEISEEQDKSFRSYSYDFYKKEMERMTYNYCMDNHIRHDMYKELISDIDKYLDDAISFVNEFDKCLSEIGKDYSDIEDELNVSADEGEIKLGIVLSYIQYLGDITTDFQRARDYYEYDLLTDKLEKETKKAKEHYDDVYEYYVKMHPNATQDELDSKRQLCDDNAQKEVESLRNEVLEKKESLEQYGREKTILDKYDIERIRYMMEYVE